MSNDDFEVRLADDLRRAADPVSTAAPIGGRDLIDRRLRQRSARRKRNLGLGAAAAVVVLGGGVLALRPDPPTRVKFGASLAGPSAPAVATGYATGSMSGAPTGWSHPQVDPTAVALPKVVIALDNSWTPSTAFAQTTSQGSGTAAAPLAVLADLGGPQPRVLVASVQTPSTLGPGSGGEPIAADGLMGRVLTDHGPTGAVTVIVDLPGGHRVQATAFGLDRATVLARLATLHQDQGTWVMDATDGLAVVPAPTVTSSTSRSLGWTATTPGSSTGPARDGAGISLDVTTGGSYEFYADVAVLGATSSLTTPTISIPGRHVIATAGSSTTTGYGEMLALDDQGIVYHVSEWSGSDPTRTLSSVILSTATDAEWAAMLQAAVLNQAAEQQAAIAQKQSLQNQASAGSGAVVKVPPTTQTTTTIVGSAMSTSLPPAATTTGPGAP